MKAIVCELCGSQHLTKKDDMYVCESCGTKYAPEEAKRLLVEVAVKQDNSQRLENNLVLARRAAENNDNESAKKYYEAVLIDDPQSWEAAFYSVYYRSATYYINNINFACNSLINVFASTFELIKMDEMVDKKSAVTKVAESCVTFAETMYKTSINFHQISMGVLFACGENIETHFAGDNDVAAVSALPTKFAVEMVEKTSEFKHKYIEEKVRMIDKYVPGYKSGWEERKSKEKKLLGFLILACLIGYIAIVFGALYEIWGFVVVGVVVAVLSMVVPAFIPIVMRKIKNDVHMRNTSKDSKRSQ